MGISLTFARLSPSGGQVGYALLTRAPVDAHQKQAFDVVSPRLACVKPVASVHPEPGSNSLIFVFNRSLSGTASNRHQSAIS